jgi:hypothetical protein
MKKVSLIFSLLKQKQNTQAGESGIYKKALSRGIKLASKQGNFEIVRFFLKQNAPTGGTLFLAKQGGHTKVVKLLEHHQRH